MKNKEFKGKLNLNKVTISKLNDEEMSKIGGGEVQPETFSFWCGISTVTKICITVTAQASCVADKCIVYA